MKSHFRVLSVVFLTALVNSCFAESDKTNIAAFPATKTNGISGKVDSVSTQKVVNADLITVGGTVYKNYKVLRVENDAVVVMHRGGVASVPGSSLPEDLQIQYHFKETPKGASSYIPKTVILENNPVIKQMPAYVESERVKRLRGAAEGGDASAQLELGLCYGRGQGILGSASKAVDWILKSAKQGNHEAIKIMEEVYKMQETFLRGSGINMGVLAAVDVWFRSEAAYLESIGADY